MGYLFWWPINLIWWFMFDIPKEIIKVNFSSPVKNEKYKKANINKVHQKDKKFYQLSSYTQTQAFHSNFDESELKEKIFELFGNAFLIMEIYTNDFIYGYRMTSKGKLLSNKRINKEIISPIDHNKKKEYLLEGHNIPALVDLGILTKEGKIINSSYDKYKQINRYIEMLDDIIKNETKLKIIDFGCGKSYLTFIVYYYLKFIKNIDVEIVGIDLKEDVINKCNFLAKKYNYDKLSFFAGRIEEFNIDSSYNLIMTLHACDTATDYALAHAIKNKIKYIFSVPCCQHEINTNSNLDNMHLVSKFGILKERMSAILTDAIRANILQYYGYKTQVLEFIDFEATPKNLLIRATLTNNKNLKAKEEVENLLKEINTTQALYELTIKEENKK